jgi:hypothetical protein
MTALPPISHHLNLYEYWTQKRAGRPMPLRSDIDPAEIPQLLAHVALIDRHAGSYRWRLMGTAIASDLGRDLTGRSFGQYVTAPAYLRSVIATFDRVFARRRPVFEESVYENRFGNLQSLSRLLLPLAASDGTTQMLIMSRIARNGSNVQATRDWLKGAAGAICNTLEIDSMEELERRAAAWDRSTATDCPAPALAPG